MVCSVQRSPPAWFDAHLPLRLPNEKQWFTRSRYRQPPFGRQLLWKLIVCNRKLFEFLLTAEKVGLRIPGRRLSDQRTQLRSSTTAPPSQTKSKPWWNVSLKPTQTQYCPYNLGNIAPVKNDLTRIPRSHRRKAVLIITPVHAMRNYA
jgi:hypothetical protein